LLSKCKHWESKILFWKRNWTTTKMWGRVR